jgi:hypothetical protein
MLLIHQIKRRNKMKAIAMVELPDDAFDDETWGDGKWMIDDEGAIRYKEDDAWMHYKDIDGIELRPLPEMKEETVMFQTSNYDVDWYEDSYAVAYNDCLRDVLGETE